MPPRDPAFAPPAPSAGRDLGAQYRRWDEWAKGPDPGAAAPLERAAKLTAEDLQGLRWTVGEPMDEAQFAAYREAKGGSVRVVGKK